MNLGPIVRKEFRQIRRDKRALGILILLPGMLLVLVGYALNFDVKHLAIGVLDEDRTKESREFVSALTQSEYLVQAGAVETRKDIDRVLEDGRSHLVLVIPKDFSRSLARGEAATIQVIIDGANPNTASIAAGYISLGIQDYSTRIAAEWFMRRGREVRLPVDVHPKLLFNPELKSSHYLVPGLFGLILMLATVISTSLSVVREKEMGTMEQLKTSPLKAYEIIIGKAVPYIGIGLFSATVILILGYLMFGVVVRGNIFLLYGAILLFIMAGLGQGLLISSVSGNQQMAFFLSIFSSLLPTFLLSGFIFPIKSMPIVLQVVANVQPTKFFLIIVRSVILKGIGIGPVWEQYAYLGIFTFVTVAISSIRLHKELSS